MFVRVDVTRVKLGQYSVGLSNPLYCTTLPDLNFLAAVLTAIGVNFQLHRAFQGYRSSISRPRHKHRLFSRTYLKSGMVALDVLCRRNSAVLKLANYWYFVMSMSVVRTRIFAR